jgi:hypothetical protein
MTPEQKARVEMNALLAAEGMHVCDMVQADIHPAIDVAIRDLPLATGFGFADYLFHVNDRVCGFNEARKQGPTLMGIELQSGCYAKAVAGGISVAEVEKQFSRLDEAVTNLQRVKANLPNATKPLSSKLPSKAAS